MPRITEINKTPTVVLQFKDLDVGDMFAISGAPDFIAIKVQPEVTKDRHDAVVLSNRTGNGYTKPGHHTHIVHSTAVRLVDRVTFNVP